MRREATPASVPAVQVGDAIDVADLPSYGFAYRSLMWWGNAGMMTIEGVAFAFMIVIYFYLRSLAPTWPDSGRAPDLLQRHHRGHARQRGARPQRLDQRRPRRRPLLLDQLHQQVVHVDLLVRRAGRKRLQPRLDPVGLARRQDRFEGAVADDLVLVRRDDAGKPLLRIQPADALDDAEHLVA